MEFSMNGWMTLTICSAPMETAISRGAVEAAAKLLLVIPQPSAPAVLAEVVRADRKAERGQTEPQTPAVAAEERAGILPQEEAEVRAI